MKIDFSEGEGDVADRETTSKLRAVAPLRMQSEKIDKRVRTEELVSSHGAVKLLNDDSVELFKETLPRVNLISMPLSGNYVGP